MGLFAKAEKPAYHQYEFKSLETFGHDGIELARRRAPEKRGVAWPQIGLFVLIVLTFKVFVYVEMGGANYVHTVNDLLAGDGLERLAGILMQLDPISQWVVSFLR